MNTTPIFVTRHIGACQYCEGDFKLTEHTTMVHHGFTRPGDGQIHGDCYCVGEPPYEVSCDALKPLLSGEERHLVGLRDQYAMFQTVTKFARTEQRWIGGEYVPVLVSYEAGVTPKHEFDRAHASVLAGTATEIRRSEREIARLTKRIADWKPMPVRELTEEFIAGSTPAGRAAKDAAKALRDAAKRVREEKAATLATKKAERATRRLDMLTAARDAILALQARPIGVSRDEVIKVLTALGKKKHQSLLRGTYDDPYNWEEVLGCDDVFITLGLAQRNTALRSNIQYHTNLWHQ